MSESENAPSLNYISLINRFWASQLEYKFTGNEVKLFFYLLNISSLSGENPFMHSLIQVGIGTNMSAKSINSAQIKLVKANLIKIKTGFREDKCSLTEYTLLSEENHNSQIHKI